MYVDPLELQKVVLKPVGISANDSPKASPKSQLIQELENHKPLRKLAVKEIPQRIGGIKHFTTQKYYKESRTLVDIFMKHCSTVKSMLLERYNTLSKIRAYLANNEDYRKHLRQIRHEADMKCSRLQYHRVEIDMKVREDPIWRNLMYEIRRTNLELQQVEYDGYFVVRPVEILEEEEDAPLTWWQYIFGK